MSLEVTPEILESASDEASAVHADQRDGGTVAATSTTEALAARRPAPGVPDGRSMRSLSPNIHAHSTLATHAGHFHQQFVQMLRDSARVYEQAEGAAEQALRNAITRAEQLLVPLNSVTPTSPQVPTNSSVGLIMGGTYNPFTPSILQPLKTLYALPPPLRCSIPPSNSGPSPLSSEA